MVFCVSLLESPTTMMISKYPFFVLVCFPPVHSTNKQNSDLLNSLFGVCESIVNYYVGNKVVLIPAFNDPNDIIAANILQQLYPTRKVVSIICTELYIDGGLLHCVTQQQPKQSPR